MISMLIKGKKLEFTKNKGNLTIPIGMVAKPNKSKLSTFKDWNKKWQKK